MITQSKTDLLQFDEQHIVVAYVSDLHSKIDRVGGVFITYPGEEFTRQELLDYFFTVEPSHLVAIQIPYMEDLNMDNYVDKLEGLITKLYENDLDDLNVTHYIPSTIH